MQDSFAPIIPRRGERREWLSGRRELGASATWLGLGDGPALQN